MVSLSCKRQFNISVFAITMFYCNKLKLCCVIYRTSPKIALVRVSSLPIIAKLTILNCKHPVNVVVRQRLIFLTIFCKRLEYTSTHLKCLIARIAALLQLLSPSPGCM